MTLLEAVNKVLRSVGEAPVGSLVTSHPEVQAILSSIHSTNERRQRRGWWFNTRLLDLATNALPTGTMYARPMNRSLDYYPKDGVLHDRKTGTPVPAPIPRVELQVLVAFEDLPEEFAEFVATAAALDYASDYDSDELHLAALQADLEDSRVAVHRLHIRYFEVDRSSRILQERGWWFNTARLTLVDNGQGTEVPPNVLYARPLCGPEGFPSGGFLIDRHTRQPMVGQVECEVRYFVEDFDALPSTFRDYVSAYAELSRAQDFLPESSSIERLRFEMEATRQLAQKDHIKYAQVNLFATPYTANRMYRAYGSRYRV